MEQREADRSQEKEVRAKQKDIDDIIFCEEAWLISDR